MTQKELLYFEDAIMHIDSIIKILNHSKQIIDDDNISNFIDNELSRQQSLKEQLMNTLGDKVNE